VAVGFTHTHTHIAIHRPGCARDGHASRLTLAVCGCILHAQGCVLLAILIVCCDGAVRCFGLDEAPWLSQDATPAAPATASSISTATATASVTDGRSLSARGGRSDGDSSGGGGQGPRELRLGYLLAEGWLVWGGCSINVGGTALVFVLYGTIVLDNQRHARKVGTATAHTVSNLACPLSH
jgi:hypothetical protein